MASVWETSWADSSRTIDTHVRSLRAKLGASSWIITVRGVGYRIGRG
jgi:DNA-binding response OmpR family regulator